MPHSSRFASLAFGAFYFAVPFLTFYEFIIFRRLWNEIVYQEYERTASSGMGIEAFSNGTGGAVG
jgi:hypothetical protein